MDTSGQGHNSIFISYSHKDKQHLERLRVHLEPYRRAGVDVWEDSRIRAGHLWQEEIKRALDAAKVAILLVSADYLASDFIVNNELPPLIAAAANGNTTILSVVISACNYSDSPLAQFQAVNHLSKPLSTMLRPKREEVWARVAKSAAEVLSGPLYAGGVEDVERRFFANTPGRYATTLNDEIGGVKASQQTSDSTLPDVRFPYFARPLGPLLAGSNDDLRKARDIRRRVLRMVMDAANEDLARNDKTSDRYYGYLCLIAYLRSIFVADDWMRFEEARDATDVAIDTVEELAPLAHTIPKTEAECYEQEQIAVTQIIQDMETLGVRIIDDLSET